MLFLDKVFFSRRLLNIFVFILLIVICNTSYSARFNELEIVGSNKISPEYLYNELNFSNISDLESKANIIKERLNKANFIEDYRVNITSDDRIYVYIKEKKIIKDIKFIGNKKIKSEDIKKSVSLNKNKFFNEENVKKDIQKVIALYNSLGYLSATAFYEIEDIDNTHINLKINITENVKTTIKNITFIGNEEIKSYELKNKIASKENSFFTFGVSKDFIKERLEYDKYLLEMFYKDNGFLDFEIRDVKYELFDKYVNITYSIYEGNKYKINDIIIRNEYNVDINEDEIIENLKIKKDSYFDLSKLRDNLEKLNKKFNEKNLGFVSIIPDVYKVENDKVNLIIFLQKNKISYIGKINIKGNVRTNENVIRDIMSISEGELFNENVIKEAKQNLSVYGFYKNVDIKHNLNKENNKIDLDVNLEEDKFGTLGIGFGYSTLDKFNINFNLQQKNLFGEAMSFDASIVSSRYRRNYGLGFGKPNIFNTKMFGGFNIYYNKNMYSKYEDNNMDFDEKYAGIDLYAKYKISNNISQKIYYTFMQKNNFNISDNYKDIIEKGNVNISLIGTNFSYDTRDNIFYPLEGTYANIDLSVAGLLGENKEYFKTTLEIAKYLQVYKKLVFKTQLSSGIIRSFNGKDLYPSDGFYIGGSELRGFKYGGAGLRVREYGTNSLKDGESTGGTKYFVFNNEFRFPLVNKSGLNIFGVFFYDMGIATGLEKNSKVDLNRIEDSDKIRSSFGFATVFKTPVGNIGLEFSKAVSKESYDEDESFRVNIGMDF